MLRNVKDLKLWGHRVHIFSTQFGHYGSEATSHRWRASFWPNEFVGGTSSEQPHQLNAIWGILELGFEWDHHELGPIPTHAFSSGIYESLVLWKRSTTRFERPGWWSIENQRIWVSRFKKGVTNNKGKSIVFGWVTFGRLGIPIFGIWLGSRAPPQAFIRCFRTWSHQGINWWMWIPGASGQGKWSLPNVVMDILWAVLGIVYGIAIVGRWGEWHKNCVIFCNETYLNWVSVEYPW